MKTSTKPAPKCEMITHNGALLKEGRCGAAAHWLSPNGIKHCDEHKAIAERVHYKNPKHTPL